MACFRAQKGRVEAGGRRGRLQAYASCFRNRCRGRWRWGAGREGMGGFVGDEELNLFDREKVLTHRRMHSLLDLSMDKDRALERIRFILDSQI